MAIQQDYEKKNIMQESVAPLLTNLQTFYGDR